MDDTLPIRRLSISTVRKMSKEQKRQQSHTLSHPDLPPTTEKSPNALHWLHFSEGTDSHVSSPVVVESDDYLGRGWGGVNYSFFPVPAEEGKKGGNRFPVKASDPPPMHSPTHHHVLTAGSSDSYASSLVKPEDDESEVAFKATEEKKTWRFYAAFASLCIINLVCALDATSLAVALPIIAKALNGTGIEAFWAGTSFLLTATVFQPTFASLSHVFGRLQMLLIALTFFTVGAVVPALAQNFTVMLVGRSIQGVGGGGISALTYIIVTDMVTLKERGKWFGLITMMWAIGSVTGPVIGGALAEKASWRWIFWLNLPFCGIGFVTAPIFLRFKRKSGSVVEKLKQKDWVGSFLFIASLTALLVPMTWGGVMYAWGHWRTYVPLTVGAFGLIVFMFWSKYVAAEPILRASMFKDASALVTYFGTVVHGMILWSFLYYGPMYFEAAKGYSPTTAGIALFPWTFTTAPAAVVVGILVAKTGRYRWGIYSGWVLVTLGVGLLILLERNTPVATWVGLALVSGLGLGILYSAMSFSIQAAADARDLPFAAALYSFFRYFGQMLGVAVGGVIFQNEVRRNLLANPLLAARADEFSRDASALVETIKGLPEGQAQVKDGLIAAYVDSLHMLYMVMCGMAGAAMILSMIFTKGHTLNRGIETDQGFLGDRKLGSEEKV